MIEPGILKLFRCLRSFYPINLRKSLFPVEIRRSRLNEILSILRCVFAYRYFPERKLGIKSRYFRKNLGNPATKPIPGFVDQVSTEKSRSKVQHVFKRMWNFILSSSPNPYRCCLKFIAGITHAFDTQFSAMYGTFLRTKSETRLNEAQRAARAPFLLTLSSSRAFQPTRAGAIAIHRYQIFRTRPAVGGFIANLITDSHRRSRSNCDFSSRGIFDLSFFIDPLNFFRINGRGSCILRGI